MQTKEAAWLFQWSHFELGDENLTLIREWIAPWTLEDFAGKTVVDCGCGQGQHTAYLARKAERVVGVDLNTAEVARRRTEGLKNVSIVEADIAEFDTDERFDFVYSMGVLHHTLDPEKSFRRIARLLKPGGVILFYVYSREGNFWSRFLLEPVKRAWLRRLGRPALAKAAHAANSALTVALHTIYRLPLPFLPFYEYFAAFRELSPQRRLVTVFDMLNAPRTEYVPRATVERWLTLEGLEPVHLSRLKGVCWRASARRRAVA